MVVLLAGCWGGGNEVPNTFEETNTKLYEDLTTFQNGVDEVIEEKDLPTEVVTYYEMDSLAIGLYQLSETVYYSIISLYNTNLLGVTNPFGLEGLKVTKQEDTYTLTFTDEEGSTEIILKTSETSSSIVTKVDGKFQTRSEKIKLSDGEYAIQTIFLEEDDKYNVSEMYFKGDSGRMMIDSDVTNLPASIYNKPTAITSTFATGGDRSYVMSSNDFTYHIEDIEPLVTFVENGGSAVADVNSSLIQSSPTTTKLGNTFLGWYTSSDFSGTPITFPYPVTSDTTLYAKWQTDAGTNKATVTFNTMGGSIIAAILVNKGSAVNEPIPPTKSEMVFDGWYEDDAYNVPYNFTDSVNYDITLFAKWVQDVPEIITMTENYYNNLNDGGTGFYFGNMLNPALMDDLLINQTNSGFMNDVVLEYLGTEWSAPYILNETMYALRAHYDGTFAATYPPQSVDSTLLTPEVTINTTTNTYTVKLWITKKIGIANYDFWFVNTLSYDEATDSLHATIQCGVGTEQRTRNIIEYKRLSDGTFYSWIMFPNDLEQPDAKQHVIKTATKQVNGSVFYDRLVDVTQKPSALYRATTVKASEYTTADQVMKIESGMVTFTNKLVSRINEFQFAYMVAESTFFDMIDATYDAENPAFDYFENYYFSFDPCAGAIEDALDLIEDYDQKIIGETEDSYYNYVLTFADQAYTITATDKEDATYNYIVRAKFDPLGKVSFSFLRDDGTQYDGEIIQLSDGYAMQVVWVDYEITYSSQLLITAQGGRMSYSEDLTQLPASILTNFNATSFATTGNYYNYIFANNTLQSN